MGKPSRFGLFRVRSPLLTESIFLSFPPVNEMFQFTGLAAKHLWIQCLLIRVSRDQRLLDSYPELFAVFHARHRLLTPRHPPCALSSLTTNIQNSLSHNSAAALRPKPHYEISTRIQGSYLLIRRSHKLQLHSSNDSSIRLVFAILPPGPLACAQPSNHIDLR